MALVRQYEDSDYWPDFGTLVVRDTWTEERSEGLFDESAWAGWPSGTIAWSGQGWLHTSVGDGPCTVRISLHDAPPPGGPAAPDVVEVPYRCMSGAVGLTDVAGGPGDEHLRLAGPGDYRVRLSRHPLAPTGAPQADLDDPEALWMLDFWPTSPAEPPHWLARSTPAVRPSDPGWRAILAYDAVDLVSSIWSARDDDGYTTVEALEQWGIVHQRGPGWLNEPVRHDRFDFAPAAAQLGVPAPSVLRDLLAFFTAAGWLTFDGVRYRNAPNPPRVQDVLELPPEQVANLELHQGADQFSGLATDVAMIALWGGSQQTVSFLAARTLVSHGDVRAAIAWAERSGRLQVEGSIDSGPLLTPLPAKS